MTDFHPAAHALTDPTRPAIIMAETGVTISYGELDALSNRFAHLARSRGLAAGDRIAICLENHPLYLAICWGAQRAGLIYVPISSRLAAPEVAYIVEDSGARLLIGSAYLGSLLDSVLDIVPGVEQLRFAGEGAQNLDAALGAMPVTPAEDERAGCDMLYSSGTTGRPKGVHSQIPSDPEIGAIGPLASLAQQLFGFGPDTVYLSPAPLYHSGPIRWTMAVHRLGGTVVIMEKFDAQGALAVIERYRVTASQWVPTHLVRLLALPVEVREHYDRSLLRTAIHAAAPCPVPVKRAMIDWWGPIIEEYYASTESKGLTYLSSAEWLAHPGSVGRAVHGIVHICDEHGEEVPARTEGVVYFESDAQFSYYNDPEKTREAMNARGWATAGDIGWLDEDGYLYLTDRKSFMIISGGVNIYPQEIENQLLEHPQIVDAAVIGVPDPQMGERVVAVIQPVNIADAGPSLAEDITRWLAPRLSRVKLPRQIDFSAELPREPTGKLLKRQLRDAYSAVATPADG